MSHVIRSSLHVLIVAIVMVVAAAEVTWMGDRVAHQRAARGHDHAPGKVINLPLIALK